MGVRPIAATVQALPVVLLLAATACGGSEAGNSTPGAQAPRTAPPSAGYQQHVSAGRIAPPAGSLRNPVQPDPSSPALGERLFGAMNCDGCHGGGALGWVGPSLVDGRWRYGGDDAALYQSIFYGRPRGMPAYGGILAPAAIWQMVTYLRSQPVPKEVPTEGWR